MPSELAQQMRDVVLDVKESMCTQISARQCEARRERSQIAQCNGLMWVWLWVTGCVRLCLMHMSVQVCVSVSERDTMRWEYCTKCVCGLFIVCVCVCVCVQCMCVFGPMRLCLCVAPVVLLESMVTSAGVSKWQGLFVDVVICSEKTGTDSWWRQQEGATTSPPPPHHTKCHLFPGWLIQPSPWKEQTFKTLWHVSETLPLSHCRWCSQNWQHPSRWSWLGDIPSLVSVSSHPRQGLISSSSANINSIRRRAEVQQEDIWWHTHTHTHACSGERRCALREAWGGD